MRATPSRRILLIDNNPLIPKSPRDALEWDGLNVTDWGAGAIDAIMNRAALLAQLAEAQQHVSDANRRLARQRALIERLAQDGHNTVYAEGLLRHLEESQALLAARRDGLLTELKRLPTQDRTGVL